MDPNTALGTGLAVWGSKELLIKLLGPTADYLGGGLKDVVEKCNVNLGRIFKNATQKLGDKLEQPGQVNPRVLKGICEEGRFCEDELAAEYYGGILASSRTPNGRDDRGVTLLAVVKDLSVYQLRLHYLLYILFNRVFRGQWFNVGDINHAKRMQIFVPHSVYLGAMDFNDTESPNSILTHSLTGLARHQLIIQYASGDPALLMKQQIFSDIPGIITCPTLPGAELFMWAVGNSGSSGSDLLKIDVPESIEGFTIGQGVGPWRKCAKSIGTNQD